MTILPARTVSVSVDRDPGVVYRYVTDDAGLDVVNPMRIIANSDGAEVLFTLFRPRDMADNEFQRDVGFAADLQTLKRVLEGGER